MSNSKPSSTNPESVTNEAGEPSFNIADLPQIPGINNLDIKDVMKNLNISSMLNQMAANPEEVNKAMEESMNQMTPEMMEHARKLAMGGQGNQIIREMKKRGIDINAMKNQVTEQRKLMKSLNNSNKKSTSLKQVILITSSRQVRSRKISSENINDSVKSILKCVNPVELSCSRLSHGPLINKTLKVWYNPENMGKNKRASRIVGFPVGGEIVIVMEEGDLNETDLLSVEKQLE